VHVSGWLAVEGAEDAAVSPASEAAVTRRLMIITRDGRTPPALDTYLATVREQTRLATTD